jgi:hypothetical protein
MNQDNINDFTLTYVDVEKTNKEEKEENEYNEYNKKMEIVYNSLKFDYLVQVAVKELKELNEKN